MCNSSDKEFLCPSFTSKGGSKLLGVLKEDGSVGILPRPLEVSEDFIQKCTDEGFRPEERFRFVGTCAQSGCTNWVDHKCGIAGKIAKVAEEVALYGPLPPCSIRPACRWFAQEGSNACRICKFVVTEAAAIIPQ